jgi:hypothetical protein
MHEITLVLPDDLYTKLQAKAASKGMSLEGLIMEQLSVEATPIQRFQVGCSGIVTAVLEPSENIGERDLFKSESE